MKLLLRESQSKSVVHSEDARYKLGVEDICIYRLMRETLDAYTTPLLHAVREGDVQMAKVLLTCERMDPGLWCDVDHNTVLHLCAIEHASDMVPLLIDSGIFNHETENELKMTPLAFAAYEGRCDVVDVFLKSGKLKVHHADRDDYNILDQAIVGKRPTVSLVQLLLETNCFNASFDERWPHGRAFAIAQGKMELYQEISDILKAYHESHPQRPQAEEEVTS